jgi:PAS domain S-box-containing protein
MSVPPQQMGSLSNELFRQALEAAPTGMIMIDAEGRIVLVNAQVERLFGYSRSELVGSMLEMLVPERYRISHVDFRAQFFADPQTRAMGHGRELFALRRNGSEIPVEIGLTPVVTSEGSFVLASILDVTERRRSVTQLQDRTNDLATSLRERDLLLQEVHHRVKNNLQLISALINMQARRLSGEPRAALVECKRRVEAIGLIHEKLYQARSYAQVPFSDYLRSLASNLLHAADISESQIQLNCECDTVVLPVDKAISCGLLLNELLTNALQHAAECKGANLGVELRVIEGPQIELTVTEPTTDVRNQNASSGNGNSGTLGLQLVAMLTEQLEGSLSSDPDRGRTTVTFPIKM